MVEIYLNRDNKNKDRMFILTQDLANELIQVQKEFIDKSPLIVNRPYKEQRDLVSQANPDDKFYLNITQTSIEFGRYSTATRYFSIPLIRICVNNDAIHENPDGSIINGSHIHIYHEGDMDKVAFSLNDYGISTDNIITCLTRFLEICNIEKIPITDQKTLGSF